MIYYYNPPKTAADGKPFPPLLFTYGGEEKLVMAHRYWRRAVQPYVAERFFDKLGKPEIDPNTGEQRQIIMRRTVTELDEEKNKQLDAGEIPPPENAIHFTKDEWAHLGSGRQASFMQYLVSQEEMHKSEKKNFEALKIAQFAEIEKEKRAIEEERQSLKNARKQRDDLRTEIEAEIAELRASKGKRKEV